jgi:uncharacterized protein (DUF849 family)
MTDNYFITCALTGGSDTTKKNPNVPVTPKQIAKDADNAAKAGATMVHIHTRDLETKIESTDKALFLEVVDRIRQQGTDVIINLTTAIGTDVFFNEKDPSRLAPETNFWPPERRLEHIEEAMPDVCSLDVPIMNYADTAYCNLPEHVRFMAKRLKQIKVKPEIECFDLGDLWATQRFIDEGLFDDPPLIQLCMGVKYGAPATTKAIIAMFDMLPKGCVWGALGAGASQMKMAAQSVILGGNVRVGLEDNLYISKGKLATNAMLVENAVEIIQRLGGNVASVKETRKNLNLRIQ